MFISVVPFINHAHGCPYDYHRPTRFGWKAMLNSHFKHINIVAVDNNWQCIINIFTAAINNSIYRNLKRVRNLIGYKNKKETLEKGGASPESKGNMSYLYFIMKFNPINFTLGLVYMILSVFPKSKIDFEGEITSGYLFVASEKGFKK